MKILVTGAAGFIGAHLVRELELAGHWCAEVDVEHGPGHDLRNPAAIAYFLEACQPDVVVHLAAKVGRLFGEDDVMETVIDNAGMTALVAKACGEAGVRLAYASTSEVYGDAGEELCDEDIPGVAYPLEGRVGVGFHEPHNVYGLSKRWGEEACRLYAPKGLTIFRLSMPYGPGHPPGRGRAALTNFLWNALHHEPIPVHQGAERSWSWIGDTVRAMRLVLERADGGAWNIGRDDNALPLRRVAEMACELTGAPLSLIEEVPGPARQTIVKRLSTAKIRALGWEPHVELEEGMRRTLDWLRSPACA